MEQNFNPYIIKFVDKNDIVEQINDGRSDALIYKVKRGKSKFFLKVFNEKFDEDNLTKLKEHLEIYKKLNIKSLEIIAYGDIKNFNKYYIVYNFIDGLNLKTYTYSNKYTLEDAKRFGKYVGKEMLKLKNYEDYDRKLFDRNDIYSFIQEVISNVYSMLQNDKVNNIVTKYFVIDELNRLKDKLKEYSYVFQKIEPKLIHGDIKRANVMIDNYKNIHIIDCETMQVNYDIMNFKHQMTWCLFEGNEKELEFVKGYFDEIYHDTRPADFNKQVIFIIILNFLNASYNMYKKQIMINLMYM